MVNLKVNYDEYIPLRDIVFKTLREAIITGDLKPGERLMEIKLANELGVSRTPVREAIRKLELEGLVIMTARKGAEVAPINEKDLREVLEIRKVLESLACELACKNVQPENVADFLSAGVCGFGVGSPLVVPSAVRSGDDDVILARARAFTGAIAAWEASR